MSLFELLSIFRWAIAGTCLVGCVAPLLGAHLLLRRRGFYGLVLPQFASLGVALGYALLPAFATWLGPDGPTYEELLADPHGAASFLLLSAAAMTALGLGLEASFARSRATEGARAVGAFVFASAATLLLAQMSPLGAEYVDSLLRGEVLSAGLHEFEVLAAAAVPAALLLLRFQNSLLLSGFDPDTARVAGFSLVRQEAVLLLALGLVVSTATLVTGPMVLLACLLLPPLGARALARSARGYFRLSAALGLASALFGSALSLGLDQPLGPAVAIAATLLAALSGLLARFRSRCPERAPRGPWRGSDRP